MTRRVIFTDNEMQHLLRATIIQVRRPAWKPFRRQGDTGRPTGWMKVKPGDLLWVAEGYTVTEIDGSEVKGVYKADNFPFLIRGSLAPALQTRRVRQNHTMPIEASRFTLEVYDTRVELDVAVLNCRVISRNIANAREKAA